MPTTSSLFSYYYLYKIKRFAWQINVVFVFSSKTLCSNLLIASKFEVFVYPGEVGAVERSESREKTLYFIVFRIAVIPANLLTSSLPIFQNYTKSTLFSALDGS